MPLMTPVPIFNPGGSAEPATTDQVTVEAESHVMSGVEYGEPTDPFGKAVDENSVNGATCSVDVRTPEFPMESLT